MKRNNDKRNVAVQKKRLSVGKNTGGYLTVEAALIMPIVFYVCIFIIYSGFFLYDRCVMKQDAYRAVLRASSIYRQDGQEVYNAAWDMLESLTTNKYIATDCEYEVAVQRRVHVTIRGEIQVPFHGLAELTGASGWYIEETVESKCLNPVMFIRMCRQLIAAPEEE